MNRLMPVSLAAVLGAGIVIAQFIALMIVLVAGVLLLARLLAHH